jgi:hypothetical protein
MADTPALTHQEILSLKIGSTVDGLLVHGEPGHYQIIGKVDPRFMYLLRAAASLYQTLNSCQRINETFLETADLIRETEISRQLETITSSVDLVLKFSRNEA